MSDNVHGIAAQLENALMEQAFDGDWRSKDEDMVVRRYRHSSEETRDMVNACVTAMCGWSFATLARNAGYETKPYKKQKRNWEVQTWE